MCGYSLEQIEYLLHIRKLNKYWAMSDGTQSLSDDQFGWMELMKQ